MTVPKVFLSGYAKLPDNTTAQKLYNHLVLVVTAESSTGTILDADCTMATRVGATVHPGASGGLRADPRARPSGGTAESKLLRTSA